MDCVGRVSRCVNRERRVSHRRPGHHGNEEEHLEDLVGTNLATTVAPAPAGNAAATPKKWNYERRGPNGPVTWGTAATTCSGSAQSPINICNTRTGDLQKLPGKGKIEAAGYEFVKAAQIKNNGHTIQVAFKNAVTPMLTVKGLGKLVGRSNAVSEVYKLEYLQYHWGRTGMNDEGSEHWLHGKAYPLEVQFVHFNSKYASVAGALASGNKDALLMVAVLFELVDSAVQQEPTAITKVADATMYASQVRDTYSNLLGGLDLSSMFDYQGGNYSAYAGSMTTPGCGEVVTWIVMEQPKPISVTSLEKIKAAPVPETPVLISNTGNFRPLMPRGDTVVYSMQGNADTCALPDQYAFSM